MRRDSGAGLTGETATRRAPVSGGGRSADGDESGESTPAA